MLRGAPGDGKKKHDPEKEDTEKKTKLGIKKPDYVMFHNDVPVGVVETKNARYLTRKSIIQCMKQLLALHEKEQEVKKRNGPLFGVVTDALHFIFIQLTEDKRFVFEREEIGRTPRDLGPDIGDIKVHTTNTWDDLDNIATIISKLCHELIDLQGDKCTYTVLNKNQEVND